MPKSRAKSKNKSTKQNQIETPKIEKKNIAKIKNRKSEIELKINSEIERLFIKYEITDELIKGLINDKLVNDTIYLNEILNITDFNKLNIILIKLRETNVNVGSIITNICKHIKSEIIKALFKTRLPYKIITIGYPGSGKSTLAKHAMNNLMKSHNLHYANIDVDDISNFCFNIHNNDELRPLYRDIIEFFKKLAIEYNISFIYHSTGQDWESVYDGIYTIQNTENNCAFCIVKIDKKTARERMITRFINNYKKQKFGRIIPIPNFEQICYHVDKTMMNELINPEIDDDEDEEPKKFFLYDNNNGFARLIYNNLIDEPDTDGLINYIRPGTPESPQQLESTNMYSALENSPDSTSDSIGSSGGTKMKRKKMRLNKTKRK